MADEVLDGDTFRSRNDLGHSDTRLFGIDAPEKSQGEWGAASKAFEESLVQGRRVVLSPAGKSYGRTIARARLEDGTDIQIEKVRRGLALPYREFWDDISPEYAAEINAAEQEAKDKKLGYWGGYADNSNRDSPSQYRQRKKIEAGDPNAFLPVGDEVPTEKDDALSTIGGAVDTFRNITNSGLREAIDAPEDLKLKSALIAMKQAAAGKRFTSAEMLRDSINMKLGHGRVRFGQDNDDKWTFGDAVDVTYNIASDIGTDPLTYATGGLSLLYRVPAAILKGAGIGTKTAAQAAHAMAVMKELAPAGSTLRRSLMTGKAVGVEGARGIMGGMMGLGATDADDSLETKIGAAAAGAVAMSSSGGAATKALLSKAGVNRETANAITQKYIDWTGRGITKALGPDDRPLTEWWKDLQSGELRRKAEELADKEIPVGGGVGDAAVRQQVVAKRADELFAELKRPMENFLEKEATAIVDRNPKLKFDMTDPADLERRQELIQDTAAAIAETRLGGLTVSGAQQLDKAGQAAIDHYTRLVASGRATAMEGLDDTERAMVDAHMRRGKELFKEQREKAFKQHGFDPETQLGGALMARIKAGELTDKELADLIDAGNRDHAKWKQTQLDQQMAANPNISASELSAQASYMDSAQAQKMERWKKGYIDPSEQRAVYNHLQEIGERKLQGINQMAIDTTKETWEQTALKDLSAKTRSSVEQWKEHNANVVEEYNKHWRRFDDAGEQITTDMQGIPWHTSDVFSKELAGGAEEMLHAQRVARAKMARLEGSTDAAKVLGEDKAYLVYARQMAKTFVNESQRRAMSVMRGYRTMDAAQGPVRAMERMLKGYDKMTNFAKANMLYFSESWIKNNYWDNLAKAYIEGGLHNAIDAAGMRIFQKNVRRDLKSIASGNFKHAFVSSEMEQAVAYGVMEGPAFNALIDQTEFEAMNHANPALEGFKKNREQTGPNVVARMMDGWTDFLGRTMGRAGSYMESSARFVTWQNLKKQLMESPQYAGQAEKAAFDAAQIVKKTFFDYGDVTMLETAVFKRMIPFYSFYSKNLPYWTGVLRDPKRLSRLAHIQHARDQAGSPLSRSEKDQLSPWIVENYGRKIGTDDQGNSTYVISPSFSMDDAMNWLANPGDSALDKLHPMLRLGIEGATGEDLFSGGKVAPTEIGRQPGGWVDQEKAKKFLYSRGFKLVAIKEMGKALGLGDDWMQVKVDKRGNPYAQSDKLVWGWRAFDTVFPMPILDQIAGSIGKGVYDKETVMQIISNRLAPLQHMEVSPQQKAFNRKLNREARGEQ